MAAIENTFLRAQLEQRQKRLQAAVAEPHPNAALANLLREVDSALERMDRGTYGICEACHESIEEDRLLADPLVCLCLDHLTPQQQRALESDLELAAQVQRTLLPPNDIRAAGWHFHYRWQPFRLVSGDYCDLIYSKDGAEEIWFLLGDVSGKGVAASMLMTHLHAIFRSLTSRAAPSAEGKLSYGLPAGSPAGNGGHSLDQLMLMANRIFCESIMAGQFATMVAGRASSDGRVEIVNAGHCPVLVVKSDGVTRLSSTGVPLGMFCDGTATIQTVSLDKGEMLFLYTDGLSETCNPAGVQFGDERLGSFLEGNRAKAPDALVKACLREMEGFSAGTPSTDDLTMMVIQRTAA
jgi:sigma-B regulation protein RsbU (phosphoserine phosphatase)